VVVGKVEFYANTNEKVEFALFALRSKLGGCGDEWLTIF
jgi:hypothetical protein